MELEKQIKFYLEFLKENEILLLKSEDIYFKNHYSSSPLSKLTNFQGSEGEAIIDKNGHITLFVDTRYHILAQKQIFKDIELYKMKLGETFFEAFQKKYKKNTVLYVPNDILLYKYIEYDKYFDLRTYKLKESFSKNEDIDYSKEIFQISNSIEKNDAEFKINKLKKINSNIDKMLIFNLDEISYLTNLRSFQMKYSSNFKSILYLDFKNSKYILFLEDIPKNLSIKGLIFKRLEEFKGFISIVEANIYIDYYNISLDNFLSIKKPKEYKNNNLSLLSSIKPISAIEDMVISFNKLDCAIYEFKKQIKKGMSEVDLVKIFENELSKQGSIQPSFKTILSIEENTASIHYSTYDKNKILNDENLLLLDCGGYWSSGFATDITRTFYFGQKPKNIYKKIYTAVLKAFIQKLDLLARNILQEYEKDGFYFNHGLGHGIGTSCHQNPPRLSIKSNDIIKPFQTHSIEPGLYGKSISSDIEFGVRIENCVYYNLNYERFSLSKFSFEDILIDYNMLNTQEKEFVGKWQADFEHNRN